MENYSTLKKIYIILLILLGLNLLALLNSTTTIANVASPNESNNENIIVKSNYIKLSYELLNLEKKLNELSKYNNQMYFRIMGIDADVIEVPNFLNKIDRLSTDSILKNLDERTIKASRLMSIELNKMILLSNNLKNDKILNNYPSLSPIKTGDFIEISTGFGWTNSRYFKAPIFHQGVDIVAKQYSKIYSTISGYVSKVVYSKYGYGNKIIIKNTQGFEVLYAHLSSINIKKGQYVNKGQIIGMVGSTGMSTGAHLHYEIRKNDSLKNPLAYFYTYLNNKLIASNEN